MAKDSALKPKAGQGLMFNWNGHLWDAYEVLGVEQGASEQEVKRAYQEQIDRINKHSTAFVTMAFQLIMNQYESED